MTNCVICHEVIDTNIDNIIHCGNDKCEFISRTMFIDDNYIYDYVNKNYHETIFLLNTVKYSINNKKSYSPCPIFYNIMSENEVLIEIYKIFNILNIKNLVDDILKLKNDKNIFDKYGIITYGVIKFTIKSNLITIKKKQIFNIDNITTFEVEHFQYNINTFNKQKENEGSNYFFHGSVNYNWYSIMMNGIKNYSNTPNMTNGNAYGSGVYLSNTIQISLNYCKSKNINSIIGIFEVIGDYNKYKKTDVTFVVPDDTQLKLKYIITFKNTNINGKIYDIINTHFNKNVVIHKQTQKLFFNNLSSKRIMIEYQKISKLEPKDTGLTFEIDENNLNIWNVYINDFDKKSQLYKDMTSLNIKYIHMEIRFNDQFPIKPPFVRIINPRFVFKTGHITIGGSICMELLTNQGWSPANSIENLMINIKSLILDGEGIIDKKNYKHNYSYEESQDAFKRMLLTHGWE